MFASTLTDSRHRAERLAGDAWDQMLSLADSAKYAGRRTAGGALSGAGGTADEARRRAALAFDALAGRRAPVPWAWLVAAAAVGAAVGWAAGTASRAAIARMGDSADRVDDLEFVEADQMRSSLDR